MMESGKRCTGACDFNVEARNVSIWPICMSVTALSLMLKPAAAEVMQAQPTKVVGVR
jgi:hypothetical protein